MFKDNEVECMVLFLVNKNVKVRDSKYRGIWVLSFNGEQREHWECYIIIC